MRLLPRAPGIALKISALVTLLIVAEMILLNALLGALGPAYHLATVAVFVAGSLVVGLLLALGLDFLVTRPLVSLAGQVRRMSTQGYQEPIVARGRDEPRELGEALEQLRRTVVSQQGELHRLNEELEARVEARTAELRRAQEKLIQAEKLASIGELAGGVAHEVNNPTGVILARASYLCSVADDEGFDPDVIEDLEVLVHQAKRIKAVTGDLLTFARRTGENRVAMDLVEVCQLTTNLLKHTARKASVEVRMEIPGRALVLGNRDGLEQVVFNLVKNAIQATPAGGKVLVRIHCAPDEPQVTLCVDDTGPGVPEEYHTRVFDPFFTTKPVGEGTGLGLAVVYGIVTDHQGTIVVERSPEGGARFRVQLPVPPPIADSIADSVADPVAEPVAGPGAEPGSTAPEVSP